MPDTADYDDFDGFDCLEDEFDFLMDDDFTGFDEDEDFDDDDF